MTESPSTVERDELRLLPIYCPVPAAINANAAEVETVCIEWIDEYQLYDSPETRQRLIETRAAEVYSMALPRAAPARVADVAKWLYWGFATDDLYYDNGPSSVNAADFLRMAAQLVRIAEEPAARFSDEIPYSEALRGLTHDILRHASVAQRVEWSSTARAWFFGMAWDVGNAERGTPPSINEYLSMRMHTGGLASWVTTLCIANGVHVSADVSGRRAVRALTEAWATFALLLNDLMSYAKEQENGDHSGNIISVMANELRCGVEVAVYQAQALADQIASRYVELREAILIDADSELRAMIKSLDHSWRGIIDWGFSSPRYVYSTVTREKLVEFPGWAETPLCTAGESLPYASVAWWWSSDLTD